MTGSSAASNGSSHTPPVPSTTTPDYTNLGGIAPSTVQPPPGTSPRSAPAFHPLTALAAQPRFPQGVPSPGQGVLGRPSPQGTTYNPYATSSATVGLGDNSTGAGTGTRRPSDVSSPHPLGGGDASVFRRPLPPPSSSGSAGSPWQVFATPGANPSNQHLSLPPSRAGSETPEDFLAPDDIVGPLGAMSNMAGLVEAAVERAREERSSISSPVGAKRSSLAEGDGSTDDRGTKRARFGSNIPAVVEAQGLPQTLAPTKPKSKVKRTHVHAYPDCVDSGFVSEEEARELMGM